MIRVLLVDHATVDCSPLRLALRGADDIAVAAEVADYAGLVAALRTEVPGVLVLDLGIAGRPGIDALKAVREKHPRLPVVAVDRLPESHYGPRALRAGASGFVPRASASASLAGAVRAAAAGRKHVSPDLAAHLAERLSKPAALLPHEHLSDREFEMLRLAASGRKLAEVAALLHVSPKTVSACRARVRGKLNLQSIEELSSYAVAHGLV